jgi:predicted Zn-dependent peptidase
MKYYTSKIDSKNICYVNLIIHIGNDDETEKEKEYAHIMEHLFSFNTSRKYPLYHQVRSIFTDLGITIDATTYDHYTKYSFSCHTKHLKILIDILHETINHFQIDETIFKQEIISVILELKSIQETPENLLYHKMNAILFPKHARSYSIKDRIRSAKNCSKNDIMKYYKKYYRHDNIYMLICGDFTPTLIRELHIGHKVPLKITRNSSIPIMKNHRRLYKVKKTTDKAYIHVVYRQYYNIFDRKKYFTDILLFILAGTLDAILYNQLRSKYGLIYSIQVDNEIDTRTNMSHIIFKTNTVDKKSNIIKIIKIITETLSNLSLDEITRHLCKYKSKLKLIISKEINCKNGVNILGYVNKYIINEQKPMEYTKHLKEYNTVTADELYHFSKEIFNINQQMVVYSSDNAIDNI